jgi:hypothetical protein
LANAKRGFLVINAGTKHASASADDNITALALVVVKYFLYKGFAKN